MVINISDYLKRKTKTYDGRMSENSLHNKIKEMIHRANTTKDTDDEIYDFIICSFSDGDIVMIYNELGYGEWVRFMSAVISEEISERNKIVHKIKWWKR